MVGGSVVTMAAAKVEHWVVEWGDLRYINLETQ